MQKLAITVGAIAFLIVPALAASDKPFVVAEEGKVSVQIGDRDDHDRGHKDVDRHPHHKIVIVHKRHDDDHDHGDHDKDKH
jgi:hypothetical protein